MANDSLSAWLDWWESKGTAISICPVGYGGSVVSPGTQSQVGTSTTVGGGGTASNTESGSSGSWGSTTGNDVSGRPLDYAEFAGLVAAIPIFTWVVFDAVAALEISGIAGVTSWSAGLHVSTAGTTSTLGSGASIAVIPIGLVIAGFLLGPPRDPREIDQDTDWGGSTVGSDPETPENPQPVLEVAQFVVGVNAYFVEILRGTAKADHLVGNGGLSGFEGDDTLTGGEGRHPHGRL
jgi:hypothetical protein